MSFTTFTLNEADLTGKKLDEFVKTPETDVPLSDGLQWWMEWYPAGECEKAKDHVSVFFYVNKPVKAKYTFAVVGSSIKCTGIKEFIDVSCGYGFSKFASHDQLRPLFHEGKVTITCNVEFTSSIQSIPVPPTVNQMFEHTPPDFDLVVESKRLKVHKNFLSLISSYYRAMFSHNFQESESGKATITDFNYDVVKTAIDYCYGRELKYLCAETYVDVLQFADKCDIKALVNNWEKLLPSNLSNATFCDFLKYAYDFEKQALLTECYKYFKDHHDEVKSLDAFSYLPPSLVIDVLKSTFDLQTDFDVLRHVHKHNIDFIRDHLEQPLLQAMTIDDYSLIASYAWDCSREELQNACAKFLDDNRDQITTHDAFLDLPGDTIRDILKFTSKTRKRPHQSVEIGEVNAVRRSKRASKAKKR